MPHKSEVYLHFVWGTWKREPIITPEWENRIYGCIRSEIERLGCEVEAIGGISDHVHVVVRMNSKTSIFMIAKQAKAVSTRMVNDNKPGGDAFKWQPGYGVFSLSRPHLERAIAYVSNQKKHHDFGRIWRAWEETGDDFRK